MVCRRAWSPRLPPKSKSYDLRGSAVSRSRRSLGSSRRFGRRACTGCPPVSSCRSDRSASGVRKRASTRWASVQGSIRAVRSKGRACLSSASGDSSATGQFFNFLWPQQRIEGDNLVRFIRYEGQRGEKRWIAADQQSGMAV
jgi:hypothetical protein